MTTNVSNAVAAVVASLSGAPAVAPQVARVRLRPLGANATTAVIVRPINLEPGPEEVYPYSQPVSWTSAISVECYARSSVATPPDVAVDSLVESVHGRLMADNTLGGVLLGLRLQGITWDFDADGEQTTCAALTYTARHRAVGNTIN
jgi:hypothetical protein